VKEDAKMRGLSSSLVIGNIESRKKSNEKNMKKLELRRTGRFRKMRIG